MLHVNSVLVWIFCLNMCFDPSGLTSSSKEVYEPITSELRELHRLCEN